MSCMVNVAAALGVRPGSFVRWLSVLSTTRIASSTTIPIARMRPNRVTVLIDMPSSTSTAGVATRETGTAIAGSASTGSSPKTDK
jgi:hypothetical protein